MPNQYAHPWTQEDITFLENNIHKLTYKQMGRYINRSPASIQSKIRKLPFQQKVKKHPVNSTFFRTCSPVMSYVLGFIAADGNICHSGKAHTLHIANDDIDIILKIKEVLNYRGPIHLKSRPNGKISYSLRICDPIIFQDLNKLGVTVRKSLTVTPPPMPKQLIRHFIRGYFDGDGTVVVTNNMYPGKLNTVFYTGSLPMINFLHTVLTKVLKNSYKGNVITRLADEKTPYHSISLGHKSSVLLFSYMYLNTNLYLERKYKKFIEGMNYDS